MLNSSTDIVNPSVMEKFVSYLESADAEPKTVHNKVLVVALMLKFAGVKNPSKMVELEAVEDAPVEPYRAEDLKRLFDKMERSLRFGISFSSTRLAAKVKCNMRSGTTSTGKV